MVLFLNPSGLHYYQYIFSEHVLNTSQTKKIVTCKRRR